MVDGPKKKFIIDLCQGRKYASERQMFTLDPTGNYMFKANNRNALTRCEICSKLPIKTPE